MWDSCSVSYDPQIKQVMFLFIIAEGQVAGMDRKGKGVAVLADAGSAFEHERMSLNYRTLRFRVPKRTKGSENQRDRVPFQRRVVFQLRWQKKVHMPWRTVCFSAFLMSMEVDSEHHVWRRLLDGFPWWESRNFWGEKAWRRWQITGDVRLCGWKRWHSYGPRRQEVGSYPHLDSYLTLEKFPSRTLVCRSASKCHS